MKIKGFFLFIEVILLMNLIFVDSVNYDLVKKIDEDEYIDGNIQVDELVKHSETGNIAKIKEVDKWKLILVNPWNSLEEDVNIKLARLGYEHYVDERIVDSLNKMLDDCKKEGMHAIVCSSYRTIEKQKELYNKQIKKQRLLGLSDRDAKNEAGKWVAKPGTSEHHTGLAVDIVSYEYQELEKLQENTKEQKWLMENCHKYGFILRYPLDKNEVTGIRYEPWHYRYVGEEAANIIMKEKITLEEYLEKYIKDENN